MSQCVKEIKGDFTYTNTINGWINPLPEIVILTNKYLTILTCTPET